MVLSGAVAPAALKMDGVSPAKFFGEAMTGMSSAVNGMMSGAKRPREEGAPPEDDGKFSWAGMQQMFNQFHTQITQEMNAKFTEQQHQITALKTDVTTCKELHDSHTAKITQIEQAMQKAVQKEVKECTDKVMASMRSTSCGPMPSGLMVKGCEQNDADDEEAKMKLQLRIKGKIQRADYNVKVAEVLSSVQLGLAELGAKVMGGGYNEKLDQTRVTVKFNDMEEKSMCRNALVDIEDNFAPKAVCNGAPVEVWRVDPKYVKARQSKFFTAARMLARKKGLNFEREIDLNPKWDERTMCTKDGTLLGFQDIETWEFCVAAPSTA